MRLCISIASILFVTTPAVAATITVRPATPDRPIVVVVAGALAAFDEDQFTAKTAPLSSAFVAFNSDESGVVTAVVDAYLRKIGLPYEAVIYITQTASNEMTWLNMSDAAQRGIRVTLLSSLAKETMAAIPTRYGDVIVTRDDPECCVGHIRYGDQLVELASTGQIYASLEGVYKVKEGDLVVMSSPSGARGSPPRYYVLLVGQDGMTNLTGSDFGTSDGTFKATQRDDEVHFDLGLQKWNRHSGYSLIGATGHFAEERMRGGPQYSCDMCSIAGMQRGENLRQIRNGQPALLQQSRRDASIHLSKLL